MESRATHGEPVCIGDGPALGVDIDLHVGDVEDEVSMGTTPTRRLSRGNGPMGVILQQLGIDRMNIDDRVALAEAIWESVEREARDAPLTESQSLELDRRIADSLARPEAVTPWEVVYEGVLKRDRR